jgi:O-antigen ligase
MSEFSISRNQLAGAIVTSMFALYVILLPRFTYSAKVMYVLLILTAFGYLAFNIRQIRQTSRLERAFFVVMVANFSWIVVTFYLSGKPSASDSFIWNRHVYMLSLIPMFFLFRRYKISDQTFIILLVCSVALSSADMAIALAQGVDHRFKGMNPNGFAPIQLCLAGTLFFYFLRIQQPWLRWLALAGTILGVINVILSLSKMTWISLVLLIVIFMLYLARSEPLWKKLAVIAALLILITSSYSIPMVNKRVTRAGAEISSYFACYDYRDACRRSSFGTRAELGKAAWYIFLENPWTGVGVGAFRPLAKANSERYKVNDIVHKYNSVHNQYLMVLASRGIPGLILFLLFMTLPIYIAMKSKSHETDIGPAQLSVIFISLTYLIGGVAENYFESKTAILFVSVYMALMLARISPVEAVASQPCLP